MKPKIQSSSHKHSGVTKRSQQQAEQAQNGSLGSVETPDACDPCLGLPTQGTPLKSRGLHLPTHFKQGEEAALNAGASHETIAEQRANLLMESMWSTGLRIAESRGVFDPEQTVLDAVHTSVNRYDPNHGLKLENFFLMVLYGYINGYWRLQKNQWHAKLVRLELDDQADHD
ncbi:MAG: hypothetical protein JNN07_27255 [Verrucomicrobiales bacterium]|nr:hypothetical protein [Verrucomicrobiales bacterium]